MSRQRRNFSAKFKSDLVIELLKGEKDLNTLVVEIISSRIYSATGKKNSSTMLLLYLMTSVRIPGPLYQRSLQFYSEYLQGHCITDCLFRKLFSSENGQKKTSKSLEDLEA